MALTIAQAAEHLQTTPQSINAHVRKHGAENLDWIISENPRMIDIELYNQWLGETLPQIRQNTPRAKSDKESRQDELLSTLPSLKDLQMSDHERRLLAWSRGNGRGWSIGVIDSETYDVDDDFVQIQSHRSTAHPSTISRLLQEREEGKLFFLDLDLVTAFVANQVHQLSVDWTDSSLEEAANLLKQAHELLVAARDRKDPK